MGVIDWVIVVLYFVVVLGAGFTYHRAASKDLNAYFLGGKKIPWLALSMSGSVSNFDITGTMWIVSVLFVLGMKSMWHHWMWGFLMGAFFMAYMGKWVRRSGVMTAAEWMTTRFGDDGGGRMARLAYALMAILTQAGFVGYAFQGIGKFAKEYIPLEQLVHAGSPVWLQALCVTYEAQTLAVLIISITTLYVVLGGLYSVVVTDVIQTVVLTLGSLFIASMAWARLTPEALATLPDGWTSLSVPWTIDDPASREAGFHFFGALVIVWIMKGLLLNAGGPGQMYDFQRFLAARSPKEASKVGAAWSLFLLVRWAMAVGIALLALVGIKDITDSEQVMPIVLNELLPVGIRGLVIAGLLAAFMSTFSSTVNSGASFIVRDIWQLYLKPDATEEQAVRFSAWATVLLVVLGIAIGFQARSIAQIWGWIMMALGAGVVIPNVLRWHWWRLNGWGYSIGIIGGIVLSCWSLIQPQTPVYIVFPAICLASLVGCVAGSLLSKPVPKEILVSFYRTVRPFGWWKPARDEAGGVAPEPPGGRTVLNVCLGMAAIATLYLAPMYLVGHWYGDAGLCAGIAVVCCAILKFTWYDRLED